VWVGMEYRYMQAVGRLIDAVRSGTVGRLWMIAIREHRFPFLTKVDDWNRFNRNTGGTLVEKCCHFFDLMNRIAVRRPVRVYASGGRDVNHLDEIYNGQTPDLCMFAENSVHEVEIAVTGERGKVQAFEPDHELVVCRRDGSAAQREGFGVDATVRAAGAHHGATFFEHRAFLEAIRNGGKPAVSVEDGALAVSVGAAAERSIRERRLVELRELGF
jgi:myo-inositol 2-dehydrogenase/D-chiro-inositol 1-dehydrogenase